ncbi:MAG: type I-U CRISPR-associated protein Csb2 [Ilumatobacteraceae bacterium]
MTTTLRVDLPWGLFHATPWNRTANEGAVEWPPSLWRLLRALYSAWKVHAPDLDEAVVHELLSALAEPPTYWCPRYAEGHTRHYLPGSSHLHGISVDTAKTLDAFVATERDASLYVSWDVTLAHEAREALSRLVTGVRYLGRAETVVDVRLVGEEEVVAGQRIAVVADDDLGATTRLLSPRRPLAVDSLVARPQQIRANKRLLPPDTRWVTYRQPLADDGPLCKPWQRPPDIEVEMVRLALAGPVLPSKYEAVAVADRLRQSVMSRFGTPPSETLSGKDADGAPLSGPHHHAHYFTLATDGRRIDTVFVWVPAVGLRADEVAAIARVMRLHFPHYLSGLQDLQVAVEAIGDVRSVAPELVGPARTWTSVTPFIPAGHYRGDEESRLLAAVNRELRLRSGPPAARVRSVAGGWRQFRRYRPGKEGIQASRPAFGVTIEFDEPVLGPLALGQLSHFGLGLFGAVR